MKKPVALLSGLIFGSLALAGTSTSPSLDEFASAIHDAQSLKASYLYMQINGLRSQYEIALKKPNLARLDKPNELIVADGTSITTFNKKDKTYYKLPENADALNNLFNPEELKVWGGFFKSNAYQPFASKDLGQVTRGSMSFNQVSATADSSGHTTTDYFLDPGDKIVRQVETNINHGNDKATFLLRTSNLTVNQDVKPDMFAFTPPDGSSEISLADVLASKWYTNLAEAEKVATGTNRKIFVDFMATWCEPCHMLANAVLDQEQFKQFASDHKLVLCRIDVDLNPDLAAKYSANEIPLQMVLDASGNPLSKTVGYGGPDAFYQWLKGAVGN